MGWHFDGNTAGDGHMGSAASEISDRHRKPVAWLSANDRAACARSSKRSYQTAHSGRRSALSNQWTCLKTGIYDATTDRSIWQEHVLGSKRGGGRCLWSPGLY